MKNNNTIKETNQGKKQSINYDAIPDELKTLPQWVCWQTTIRDGKPTKIPINATTGGHAKSDDPSTWALFENAKVEEKY